MNMGGLQEYQKIVPREKFEAIGIFHMRKYSYL